jgi:hypothetical protein
MAAGGVVSVVATIDELIALFNRRSLDVPEGLFSRHTQFVLNGIPFEVRLGRPADPLVLMLARGAAGYRFAVKALQHAVPDATIQRGELLDSAGDAARTIVGQAWLSCHLRETSEPVEILLEVAIDLTGVTATRVSVVVDDQELARLQAARLRV